MRIIAATIITKLTAVRASILQPKGNSQPAFLRLIVAETDVVDRLGMRGQCQTVGENHVRVRRSGGPTVPLMPRVFI